MKFLNKEFKLNSLLTDARYRLLTKTLFITLVFLILLAWPGKRNSIDDSFENLYSLSAGQPLPDTNIVLITIDPEDLERIGPWPIKRSYYALLVNSLSEYKVKQIGLNVFLGDDESAREIYDELLVKEIRKAGNVVLASRASGIERDGGSYYAGSISYPLGYLRSNDLRTALKNIVDEEGWKIPVKVNSNRKNEKSLSFLLSGRSEDYLPDQSQVEVNIFTSWKKFEHYSLLDYFALVQERDSSLQELKDKTVLIGVNDKSVSAQYGSYLEQGIPEAAIHAFSLDNILNFRSYNNYSFFTSKIVLFLFVLSILLVQHKIKWISFFFYFITFTFLVFITFILFKFFHFRISYSSYIVPLISLMIINVFFSIYDRIKRRSNVRSAGLK